MVIFLVSSIEDFNSIMLINEITNHSCILWRDSNLENNLIEYLHCITMWLILETKGDAYLLSRDSVVSG